MIDLAVIPSRAVGSLEAQHRNVVVLCEGGHCFAEAIAHPLEQRRRRDRVAEMRGEVTHHLTADLQIGDVSVQVDAVEALQIESNVAVEHIVDVVPIAFTSQTAAILDAIH